jgi:hypothetical protein
MTSSFDKCAESYYKIDATNVFAKGLFYQSFITLYQSAD